MTFDKNEKDSINNIVRMGIYFVLTYAFIFSMYRIATVFHAKTFDECGVIENLQFAMLAVSGFVFLVHTFMYKKWQTVSLLLASCCFLAAFRELDKLFDSFYIGWKFAYIFPAAAIVCALLHFEKSVKMVLRFVTTPSFFMMFCAVIIILPIAQFVGHRPFIVAAVGRRNVVEIKEFFEECCETIGYFMILLSSAEYYINTYKK